MIASVDLPWPSKHLSPNARPHYMALARAKKKARSDAAYAAMAVGISPLSVASLKVTLTFNPPDRRARDADNLLSSCKAYLDGLSDVVGVDDSRWEVTPRKGDVVKGGRVRIELETA